MTTYGLIDVISTLAGGRIKDDLHPAWYLIIFGGFGFLFDLICMYCFSIWGDPEEMGLGAKGAPAAADVEGGAPGAPDTMWRSSAGPAPPRPRGPRPVDNVRPELATERPRRSRPRERGSAALPCSFVLIAGPCEFYDS